MIFEEILEQNCQVLGWRDSTEAYYGLDFTPFMSIIEESAKDFARIMCEKQKEICADNAEADCTVLAGDTDKEFIEVYVLKQSIIQCKNATEI